MSILTFILSINGEVRVNNTIRFSMFSSQSTGRFRSLYCSLDLNDGENYQKVVHIYKKNVIMVQVFDVVMSVHLNYYWYI